MSRLSSKAPVAQGPVPAVVQESENGAITIVPSLTKALVVLAEAPTAKSVPRTPIAATGVFSLKFSLAPFAASPEIARATPSSRFSLTAEPSGMDGS